MRQLVCRAAVCAALLFAAGTLRVHAQNPAMHSRIVQPVDESQTVKLQGNVHPLARPQFDQGALPDSQPVTHMMLLLQRSAEQETALRQLLDAQVTKGSGSYHAWLTPDQFGKQFGPSDSDVQAVTDWLTKQGFQIRRVSAGRTVIDFDGNVAQVRNAFHTDLRRYVVNDREHFANASDPAIPQALAPVVAGVAALHNFPKNSYLRQVGQFQRDRVTGQVKPLFTFTDTLGTAYAVGPADFATIYNIPGWPNVGGGQSIAIVGQSNINLQDVTDFRSLFGLPAYVPCTTPPTVGCLNIILNGPDPGLVTGILGSDEQEAALDVEWAGAVAPQAQVIFVTSQSTTVSATAGVDLSAIYIVDNNVAPVLAESYGQCESQLGTSGNAFYNALWQQAAAEGITVVVAAGDTGSAACDPNTSVNPNAASQGIAVSGIASTPFNLALGGTEFDQTATSAPTFWNATNTATQLSAKGYIPETVWDDSTCASSYLTNPVAAPCTTVDTNTGLDISAGGGGPSVIYSKPPFQTSVTPADSSRDIPDISLFSSNGFNLSFYIICQSDANPNGARCDLNVTSTTPPSSENFIGVGGTSVATPTFAAIMALVNAQSGRQGNANYVLYKLASNQGYPSNTSACNSSSFSPTAPPPASCVFNDITKGTNTVACVGGSTNCSNTASGFGVLTSGNAAYSAKPGNGAPSAITEGNPAFTAVPGYDLATGLGSVNVNNLLSSWSSATRTATTTTLTSQSGNTNTSGTNFNFTVTVSPAPLNGEAVAVNALDGSGNILGAIGFTSPAGQTTSNLLTLTSGSTGQVTTSLLPPGTVNLRAVYGGDTTLAMSTSALVPIAVSGANLASKTVLNFVTFDANNNPIPNTGSISVAYGSPYILEIAVTNSSNQSCGTVNVPCPIGNIALTDSGTALNDWPNAQNANATNIAKVNNQGLAEDQPIQLGVGSHSLQAAFTPTSGTAGSNYQASSSNTVSATITQAGTSTLLSPSATTITSGATVTLTAYVITNSNGAGPTGSVTFKSNGNTIGTGTCMATAGMANINPPITQITAGTAFCTATLTTTISSAYPTPTPDPRTPTLPRIPLLVALASLLLFLIGLRWIPQTRRCAYSYAGLLVIALLVGVIAGCGGGSSSGGGGSGTRTLAASYAGDTNYKSSNSPNVQIIVQ